MTRGHVVVILAFIGGALGAFSMGQMGAGYMLIGAATTAFPALTRQKEPPGTAPGEKVNP